MIEGQTVHFVDNVIWATGQEYKSFHCAAIIIEVHDKPPDGKGHGQCSMMVFKPTGEIVARNGNRDDNGALGTWHYVEHQ